MSVQKISVIMTLYNTPYSYLQTTIESILNQTFRDFEFIIVDDSTSVSYKDLIDGFNDNRIKYIHPPENLGPGHGRNIGIRMAQGEYIAVVDSDDVYYPERLETQLKFLHENPEISLLSGAFKYSNNGKIPNVLENDDEIKVYMLFNAPIANPLAMFKRQEFLDKNLFYPEDTKFGEDYELWIQAMFKKIKMANLKHVLMTYTRRSGQLSKAKEDFQSESLKKVYSKMLTQFGLNPSKEDIELHYNIYAQNFNIINKEQIEIWFSKIIEQNKSIQILNEATLIEFKNQTIQKMDSFSQRLFKIKIGQYNFCLSKKLKPYIEKRD